MELCSKPWGAGCPPVWCALAFKPLARGCVAQSLQPHCCMHCSVSTLQFSERGSHKSAKDCAWRPPASLGRPGLPFPGVSFPTSNFRRPYVPPHALQMTPCSPGQPSARQPPSRRRPPPRPPRMCHHPPPVSQRCLQPQLGQHRQWQHQRRQQAPPRLLCSRWPAARRLRPHCPWRLSFPRCRLSSHPRCLLSHHQPRPRQLLLSCHPLPCHPGSPPPQLRPPWQQPHRRHRRRRPGHPRHPLPPLPLWRRQRTQLAMLWLLRMMIWR